MKNETALTLEGLLGKGYKEFFDFRGRYIWLIGGREAKKTKNTALKFAIRLCSCRTSNLLCVRNVLRDNRDSTYKEMKWALQRLGRLGEWVCYGDGPNGSMEMHNKLTGQKILFRGMRGEQAQRIKGIQTDVGFVNMVWIEEAFELDSKADFDFVDGSIRGGKDGLYNPETGEVEGDAPEPEMYIQIVCTLNPVSEASWIKTDVFDKPQRKGQTLLLRTNYLMNEFISPESKARYEVMSVDDPERYKVDGLGMWGSLLASVFNSKKLGERLRACPAPVAVGEFVYDIEMLPEDRYNIRDYKFTEYDGGFISIYEQPEPGAPYIIGADTAGTGSDYFAAQVLNNVTGNQAAVLHIQQMDVDEFAKQLAFLGWHYNEALLAPEVNFGSNYVTAVLRRMNYHHLFVQPMENRYDGQTNPQYGFLTTASSRPRIIDQGVERVREGCEWLNDPKTIKELLTFARNKKGRIEAAPGAHDDLVMSLLIALDLRAKQTHKRRTAAVGGTAADDSDGDSFEPVERLDMRPSLFESPGMRKLLRSMSREERKRYYGLHSARRVGGAADVRGTK
jgi:phage terminase large subunit